MLGVTEKEKKALGYLEGGGKIENVVSVLRVEKRTG